MKTSGMIFLFTIINLICTVIFNLFLPETVIFGISSNFFATEFINKWFNLIIPVTQIIACGIIFMIDVYNRDKIHKYRYLTAYVAVCFTTFVHWTILFVQKFNFELGVALDWPWTIMLLMPIALFLLAEGFDEIFFKPMTEFSIFGFNWVKNNPMVWEKTHKFSGKACMISAILMIILAVINELLLHNNIVYLFALIEWFVIYIIGTFVRSISLAKQYKNTVSND